MCFLVKYAKKSRKTAVSNKSESVSDVRMFAFLKLRKVEFLSGLGRNIRTSANTLDFFLERKIGLEFIL